MYYTPLYNTLFLNKFMLIYIYYVTSVDSRATLKFSSFNCYSKNKTNSQALSALIN